MTSAKDIVDFYIVPVGFVSVKKQSWYVYIGTTSHCLAVHDELMGAEEHATQMAEYRVAYGGYAQIHVQQADTKLWKTVWYSPGIKPRFP